MWHVILPTLVSAYRISFGSIMFGSCLPFTPPRPTYTLATRRQPSALRLLETRATRECPEHLTLAFDSHHGAWFSRHIAVSGVAVGHVPAISITGSVLHILSKFVRHLLPAKMEQRRGPFREP
jgi:hypothetical protein